MTEKKYPVHYANFVCHFGNAELLDYLDEIVIPAFKSAGSRKFKDVRYFFHSVQVLNLGRDSSHPELAICGTFVKDMVVRSEQRYDKATDTLLPENQKMETAPSATFTLLLASHKLIYLLETANAPGLQSFRSTVNLFLIDARQRYINDVHIRAKTEELSSEETVRFREVDEKGVLTKLTKTAMYAALPPPKLEILAMTNEENLRAFVNRFETLQSATLRLVQPNSELNNDDFLDSIRTKGNDVGSEASTLTYRNSAGLLKHELVGQLEAAAKEGNTEIKLDGKDLRGQKLQGSHDEFKVVSFLETKYGELKQTARAMLSLFKAQLASGLIQTPENYLTDSAKFRLLALAKRVASANDD